MKAYLIADVVKQIEILDCLCVYPADGSPERLKDKLTEIFKIIPSLKTNFHELMEELL